MDNAHFFPALALGFLTFYDYTTGRMEHPSKRIHHRTWETYNHCHPGNKRDKLYLSASLSGNSDRQRAVFHWVFHQRHGLNTKNNSSNNRVDNNNINN